MVWQVKWLGLWVVLYGTAAKADHISDELGSDSFSQSSNDINKETSDTQQQHGQNVTEFHGKSLNGLNKESLNDRSYNSVIESCKESSPSNVSSCSPQQQDFAQHGLNVTCLLYTSR